MFASWTLRHMITSYLCENQEHVLNIHYRIILKKLTNRPPSLFRFKDVISKESQSQYINFQAVTDVTNYGKNQRHLNVRSVYHLCILHLTGKRVECKPSVVSD